METSATSSLNDTSHCTNDEESDSNWSDINSGDDDDDCERSLRIDLQPEDEAEADISTTAATSTPNRNKMPYVTFKATSTSCKKSKMKKRKPIAKRRLGLKKIEVPEDIARESHVFHKVEKTAGKFKMNRTQVKSVLREIASTPELLGVVKQYAGESSDKDGEKKTPEIRVTRTVAKNVAKEGGKLWLLDQVHEIEKTPVKKKKKEIPFMGLPELPDEEVDEDYDPTKDATATDMSDEESVGTPLSSTLMSTPPSSGVKNTIETPVSASATEAGESLFKKPEESSNVARALNFDENAAAAAKKRALRSTTSMKEVTIEELCTEFIAPDITDDMYDTVTHMDEDYTMFLAETFLKPAASDEATKKTDEGEEDEPTEDDEDYVYQEQEEDLNELKDDEYKFNRSTKISQKEADLLMEDVIEAYDLNQHQQNPKAGKNSAQGGKVTGDDFSNANAHARQWNQSMFNYQLTNDQRLLIAQHMRQHIQLVTQMSLLTSKDGQWAVLHQDCRSMLSELVNRSFNQHYSMFAQDNLFPSMQCLSDWDATFQLPTYSKEIKKVVKYELTDELINFMGDRSAFIYPELLPCSALKPNPLKAVASENELKPYFAKGEDNLIVLGLEHFYGGSDKWKRQSKGLTDAYTYIVSSMMRGKTVKQLRLRVKNRKDKCRKNEPNAIQYFFQHSQAPHNALDELKSYDASQIRAPRYAQPERLPEFWRVKLINPLKPAPPPQLASAANLTTTTTLPCSTDNGINYSLNFSLDTMGTQASASVPTSTSLIPIAPAMPITTTTITLPVIQDTQIALSKVPSPPKVTKIKPILPKNDMVHPPPPPPPTTPAATVVEIINTFDIIPTQVSSSSPMQVVEVIQDMPILSNTPIKAPVAPSTPAKKPSPDPQEPILKEAIPPAAPKSGRKQNKKEQQSVIEDEKPEEEMMRKQHEALEICMNAKEQLSADKLDQFHKIVINENSSNKRKFTDLHALCAGKMELQEMLLDLLTPGEALELGSEMYQQYCIRDAMKKFFRKVRVVFAAQPTLYTKILKDFQAILSNPQVKSDEIMNSLGNKYFKSHPVLLDEFSTFISGLPYPENLLPDPEVVDLSDVEEDEIFDEKINLCDGEDDLGGDNCPCACHHPMPASSTQHCTHCSLKFVNGRVYSRDGKTLRPVKIQFPNSGNHSKNKRRKRRKQK